MAALGLLRRLAVGEFRLLHELEENHPYHVVAVDRITVGHHRWCILHFEDASYVKVFLQADAFSEPEELIICVGLVLCVIVYTGRNADGRLACRIVTYDTVRVNVQ
jgi:hypothetical protein